MKRLIALIFVYVMTCAAWLVLAGVTSERTSDQSRALRDQVSSLWGEPQAQPAPKLTFRAVSPSSVSAAGSETITEEESTLLRLVFPEPEPEPEASAAPRTKSKGAAKAPEPKEPPRHWVLRAAPRPVAVSASEVNVGLHSDPRRKGLVWYALYDVDFDAVYSYRHERELSGYLDIELSLPTHSALYDELVFEVGGEDRRAALDPGTGTFKVTLPIRPGDELAFRAGYESRGSEIWSYMPGAGVQQLENFRLSMQTDFRDIDFPSSTLSPTDKQRLDAGWKLDWDLKSTVTGHGMGMIMPQHIQPGELSTQLILSAPVSLLFFFFLLFVLATLRKLDIHPINYCLLAGAFFAFHLLFSYSADHLTVPWAFALSSVVSLSLVVSYLRLVVSPLFAVREAALGQLVYLIGFSLAHFWEGFTGLTITVLAILTLFLLMQATGRLRWSEVLASKPRNVVSAPGPQPAAAQ